MNFQGQKVKMKVRRSRKKPVNYSIQALWPELIPASRLLYESGTAGVEPVKPGFHYPS